MKSYAYDIQQNCEARQLWSKYVAQLAEYSETENGSKFFHKH